MQVHLWGDRKHIKDHFLIDQDISKIQATPAEKWPDGDTHIGQEGSDVLVLWNCERGKVRLSEKAEYRVIVRLKKEEIAHLAMIAWKDEPFEKLVRALIS